MSMEWLRIPIALGLVFLASFGTSYLSAAWERRRKRDEDLDVVIAELPGFNCGLCGQNDCRGFARYLKQEHGDPGLCAPGGERTEVALRALLADGRSQRRVAFVRCGGKNDQAKEIFTYDGRPDCVAAAASYQGQRACTKGCLGFGTCVKACPVGAIRVAHGVARVDPQLCTGCGLCLAACPTAVITLVGKDAHWQVACNSSVSGQEKLKDCSAACTGCGECERLSASWEFSLSGSLAKAKEGVSTETAKGNWASIALRCPTGAILMDGLAPKAEAQAESAPKKG